MLTLLSPAKKLAFDKSPADIAATAPRLADDTRELAQVAKKQSAGDLKRLMKISDKLADLNADRFAAFDPDNAAEGMAPAGLVFDGDVYWGLDARTLDEDALAYAQDHLRILSGLYGVLRPLDAIQPYRLEMGTKIANPRGESLYDFWGGRIAGSLAADLADHADRTVVNLASNEYFGAVDTEALGAPVVTPGFLNIKDGEAKRPMYHVKFARGLMARWIVENRIDRADDLRGFDSEGYTYDADASSELEPVFTRPQPAPKR